MTNQEVKAEEKKFQPSPIFDMIGMFMGNKTEPSNKSESTGESGLSLDKLIGNPLKDFNLKEKLFYIILIMFIIAACAPSRLFSKPPTQL